MSNIEELKGLAELKEQGILTEEEFQKEKEKILSRGSKTEEASPKSTPEPELEYKYRPKNWETLTPEQKEAIIKNPELIKQREQIEKDEEELEKSLDEVLGMDF